jgi:hypothetical protein
LLRRVQDIEIAMLFCHGDKLPHMALGAS